MIGVPFFADQFTNIKLVEQKGYGKLIELQYITEKAFRAVVDELLTNLM